MNERQPEEGESMDRAGAVSLRPTQGGDLARVLAWERHPDNAPWVQAWPEAQHRSALSDPGQRHLMIELAGRPVGYVILAGVEPGGESVELRRIVVAEKGKGVGRSAVAHVARYAFRTLGAREMWLDVVVDNGRARHVYETCGFEVDPEADLSVEIQGVKRRLVKMTLSRRCLEPSPARR